MTVLTPSESLELRLTKIDARTLWGWIALGGALLGITAASILITYAQRELGSNAITFYRLATATVVFAIWQAKDWFYDRASSLEKFMAIQLSDIGFLFLSGISFSGSLIIWAWSMTETSIANATLLNNMLPLFTTLGGWLFLGQRFSRRFLIGMGISICGVVAIGLGDFQIPENHLIGDSAALLSAVLSAAYLLGIEQLRSKFSTSLIMFLTCLIGAGFALITMLCTEGQWFPPSWMSGLAVLSLGLVSQCLGLGLLTFCLSRFTSAVVSVSLLAVPAITAVLAWILFAETLTLVNGSTFIVVLMGIYLAISAPKSVDEQSININLVNEG